MAGRKVSESEVKFIEGGVSSNVRADGRGRLDFRPIEIETGVIPQANGSARLRLGLAPRETTDVLVGVKAEIGEPDPSSPGKGSIRFSVQVQADRSGIADEAIEAEEAGMEVARALAALVGNAGLDLGQLGIVQGKQCWDLFVDAIVLERGAGNLFDAAGLATRAALATARIPKVDLVEGDVPGLMELEVSDDPEQCKTFDCSSVPVCVTLTKIGSQFVVDASEQEERCSGARLVVGVTPKGTVCGLQKAGRSGLPPSVLPDMIHTAQKIGLSMLSKAAATLKTESEQTRPPLGFF